MLKPIDIDSICGVKKKTFENKNGVLVAVYNHGKAFQCHMKRISQSFTKTFFQDKIASSIKEEIISLSAEDCQYMVKNKACKHDKTIFNLTCGAGL